MRNPTQRDIVLDVLRRHKTGVCTDIFVYGIEPGIQRYSARIHELRDHGFRIDREKCQTHPDRRHHFQYRLIQHLLPDLPKPTGHTCYRCGAGMLFAGGHTVTARQERDTRNDPIPAHEGEPVCDTCWKVIT